MGTLGVRGRTCPRCRRTWPQRHARFCGNCGSLLGESQRHARSTARRRHLARALAGLGVVGLVAWFATFDLSRPALHTHVEVTAGLLTATSPLTDQQVAELRERADADRLRCEPRDCEAWRFDRGGASMASGVVELADGSILTMFGGVSGAGARSAPSDGEGSDDADSSDPEEQHRVVAIDPASGTQRWSRPLEDYPSVSGAYRWVRLAPGPRGGALMVAGTTVTAVDVRGEQRWSASPYVGGGPIREIRQAATTDGAVLLTGTSLSHANTNQHLTALDPTSGSLRWSVEVSQVAAMRDDQAIVVAPDGTLRALDAATGSVRWEHPGPITHARSAGPWVAAQEGGTLHLVDPTTGSTVGTTSGWLTSPLTPAGDRWIGTVRAVSGDASVWSDDAGPMQLVAFDVEGALGWTAELGTIRPWWDCCPVRVDRDEGVVVLRGPVRELDHELATGELLDARVTRLGPDADRRYAGLADLEVRALDPDLEVATTPDGRRVEVRTADGDVVLRSDRPIRIESVEPLVVSDDRELLGVRRPRDP